MKDKIKLEEVTVYNHEINNILTQILTDKVESIFKQYGLEQKLAHQITNLDEVHYANILLKSKLFKDVFEDNEYKKSIIEYSSKLIKNSKQIKNAIKKIVIDNCVDKIEGMLYF